ncbi:glycerate kinase [Actinomyces slackii]|nr:glycerate kinase [Actinomyces slackii]
MMTTVVLAPDSFKESLSASQACAALAHGLAAADPTIRCLHAPMADGGEGTAAALVSAGGWQEVAVRVADALGRPTEATLAWDPTTATACLEAAQAVGLERIAPDERDIWAADSAGVGELITRALDLGARRLVMGLGGSATNDGGAGMLRALGARLLNAAGQPIAPGPAGLRDLESIETAGLDPRLAGTEILLATDVDNPLLGERGASAVFGPQKGAGAQDVAALDAALARFADRAAQHLGADRRNAPGAGAAGGLGWAGLEFLGAGLRPGVEVVAELVGLERMIAGADLVITGEGSVDEQTLAGKTPWGVARIAIAHRVPVVVLAGRVGQGWQRLLESGISAVLPIVPGPCTLAEALDEGEENLRRTAAMLPGLMGWGSARPHSP